MNIESQIKKAVTDALTEFFQNQSQCDKPAKAKSDSPKPPKPSPKSEAPEQPDSPKSEEEINPAELKKAAPGWVKAHSMDEFKTLLSDQFNASNISTVLPKDRAELLAILKAQ